MIEAVTVLILARDEQERIGAAIASAKHLTAEIVVVVDDRTIDDTEAVVREAGAARLARVQLIGETDFSVLRNAALECVETPWVLILDADDELLERAVPVLRQAMSWGDNGLHGYSLGVQEHSGDVVASSMRLWRVSPDIAYRGRVHEEPVWLPDPAATKIGLLPGPGNGAHLVHHGYAPDVYAAKGKYARNLRLLELELADDPDSVRTLYYLARQHAMGGDPVQAEYFARSALALHSELTPAMVQDLRRLLRYRSPIANPPG